MPFNKIMFCLLFISGRTDYLIWGYYPCVIKLYLAGYKDKIIPLPQPVIKADMYMAFSEKTKYTDLLPEINRLIIKFKAEGRIDQLVKTI